MRIAFTQSVPTGFVIARRGVATAGDVATAVPPTRNPTTSAVSVTGPELSFTVRTGLPSGGGAARGAPAAT